MHGPAGGIRSSVQDLAQWVRFQMKLGVVGETRLLQSKHTAYLQAPKTLALEYSTSLAEGDAISYASGLMFETYKHHPIVWHGGATTGMRSALGYSP